MFELVRQFWSFNYKGLPLFFYFSFIKILFYLIFPNSISNYTYRDSNSSKSIFVSTVNSKGFVYFEILFYSILRLHIVKFLNL